MLSKAGKPNLLAGLCVASVVILGRHASAVAAIIYSHAGPAASSFSNSTSARAFGQSFTTPANADWDEITINFYSNNTSTTAEATGNLFLLTQAYTGTPSGLSASTTGFVAEATTLTTGEHLFNPMMRLNGATQYFIYEDQLTPINGVFADISGSGGQTLYYASGLNSSYIAAPGYEMNFLVQGTAPEPANAVIIATPAAIAFLRRRRSIPISSCLRK